MIRKSILSKVYKAIERSSFTIADFEIITPEEDDIIINIIFLPHKSFEFLVKYVESDNNRRLAQRLSPGLHETSEAKYIHSLGDIDRTVSGWCRNVRDELRASIPVYEEIDEIREIIEEHIEKNIKNPEEPFSSDEADELREKFEKLSEQFTELQEKNKITEQELNTLNREISAIKENLKGFPKGIWYKTAGTRLFDILKKIVSSKEGRDVLKSAAKKALGVDN